MLKHPLAKFLVCVLLGFILWQFDESFDLPAKGWQIFSVFIAVIFSFILRPYPMGMNVLIGLFVLASFGVITIKESLLGFGDSTVWLVIAAFLLAAAVLETGFGRRVALLMVKSWGKSVKGLAYAICGSEFMLASVLPSNTARGGGIHAPIADSLAHSLGASESDDPNNIGKFLTVVGAHANLIAASMFLTGMAANPLVTKAAKSVYNVDFGWGTWILGAIVPGLISLAFLPQLIHFLIKPKISDGSAARENAEKTLKEMGPMSRDENTMMIVLIAMLVLWGTKPLHGLGTTLVAWLGVLTLLLSHTRTWDDIISNSRAWDTLIWLGGLLTMATLLSDYGFIQWFVDSLKEMVSGVGGMTVIIVLGICYFYSMYAFSMLTAHIAAMVAPFLSVCLAAGGEPMLAVAVFAYFSCLCGCTTNYSSGPVIIYFGLGYVKAPRWFQVGFIVSIAHLIIWLGVGLVWWKLLGWW